MFEIYRKKGKISQQNTFQGSIQQPRIVNSKKRTIIKHEDATLFQNRVNDRPSTTSTFMHKRPRLSEFEKNKLKKEQKEQEIKEKYFAMYQFQPKPSIYAPKEKSQEEKETEKRVTDFAPIINGLAELQQHARKVNKIKAFQAEILDNSGSLNKSITLLDSKLQKIATSPSRIVNIPPEELSKQGRTGVSNSHTTWLK